MNVLLDTHSLLWAVDDYDRLAPQAHAALTEPDNTLFISAVSVWEIAIKLSLNKLGLSLSYRAWMSQAISDLSLSILNLELSHAEVVSGLAMHHRDPFDRALIAQSMVERMPLVSNDTAFDAYGVTRIW